ncbi:hypothetical protein ACFSVJ_16345 [Prauserella oleivorans]
MASRPGPPTRGDVLLEVGQRGRARDEQGVVGVVQQQARPTCAGVAPTSWAICWTTGSWVTFAEPGKVPPSGK